MRKSGFALRILAVAGIMVCLSAALRLAPARAQDSEKFTNLKVLPKDISKDDLDAVMSGFAHGLGVRCGYCHATKEGSPRGELDFPSDAKPEKTTARVMYKMLQDINKEDLPKITTKHPDRVVVECRTCHHGEPRPFSIEDVLSASYKAGGFDSLTARYDALRKDWYGTDTYNFGDQMLPNLGHRLAGRDHPEVVVQFAEYNVKLFPDSGPAHLSLGQAYAMAGNKDQGNAELDKAQQLDPRLKEIVQRTREHMNLAPKSR